MPRPERPPLQPVTTNTGSTVGLVAASDQDTADLLASIIRHAAETDRLQRQRRAAIIAGTIPPCPWDATDRWLIIDRD